MLVFQGVATHTIGGSSEPTPDPKASAPLEGKRPILAAQGDRLVPVQPPPLPQLTNGPHLSYAVQWFSFATIAIVGCLVLLRRDRSDILAAVAPHRREEV